MSKARIQIEAMMHPAQMDIHRSDARFRVACLGRRAGKTRLGVMECLDAAASGKRAWWVAPTYKMSEVGWRPLTMLARQIPAADVLRTDRVICLPGGGSVTVRSSDNPQSLRGDGLDLVVLDEAAYGQASAWYEALRPALSDKLGRALFLSTPKGLNYFYELYNKGRDGDGEWESWRMPTSANPFILPEEIEAARKSLPERVFRQEYLAEFVTDGSYFQNLDAACVIDVKARPKDHAGHAIFAGLDWGQSNDASQLTLGCRTCNRVVDWVRMLGIDYTTQRQMIISKCQEWSIAGILPERNSMGQPNIELLAQAGLPVLTGHDGQLGFYTLATTKPELIRRLASGLEHDGFLVPADYADELRAYEIQASASGNPRFSAPVGMHDDRVMSLAFLWRAMSTPPLLLFAV